MFVSVCRFDELVKKFEVEYHAGGATQNSIKIAQVSDLCRNTITLLQMLYSASKDDKTDLDPTCWGSRSLVDYPRAS